MVTSNEDFAVLRKAVDQVAGLLRNVSPDALTDPTPCDQWTVQDLVDHIVAAPQRFARMLREEPLDWSAPTPAAGDDPADAFRAHADDLLAAWQERGARDTPAGLDWQCAEFAVHTWDLATATGRPTDDLDPEVAERGLAFMRANLTDDNRGAAFRPEQPAPGDANAYQRIAAFAGRSV